MFQALLSGFKGLFSSGRQQSDANPSFEERRKLVRLRCSYEVKAILGEKKFKATIVDIGLQGLKLRTGQPLKVGEKLTLTPPNQVAGAATAPVEGKVLWVKTPDRNFLTYAGLVFTTDKDTMARSWIKMFLKELGFTPKTIYSQRRFIRADCFLEARFQAQGADREQVGRVYNLGVGGMLLESPQDLVLGTPVQVRLGPLDDLPALELSGIPVQMRKDGAMRLYGLEFRHSPAQSTLDLLGRYLRRLLKACWSE